MDVVRAAIASVQRNLGLVFLYIGVALAAHLANIGLDLLVVGQKPRDAEDLTLSLKIYGLATGLGLCFISAALQTVVFARMGREIDRPLWRNAGDLEALRRFCNLWLVLNLLSLVVVQLLGLAASRHIMGLQVLFFVLYVLVILLQVPVGACVMFSGAVRWNELGRDLAPLLYQLPRTLAILFVNVFQLVLLDISVNTHDQPWWLWMQPAITVVASYVDCVVFAGVWHICMEHRNTDQDIDFDF